MSTSSGFVAFIHSRYIPMIPTKQSVILLKSRWTSTNYFSNSTSSSATNSPPTLIAASHHRTVSTNTGCNQWLPLAKPILKVTHVGRNHSPVAHTSMCGWAIITHPHLLVPDHQRTPSTNIGFDQWLSLTKSPPKNNPYCKNRSPVARTSNNPPTLTGVGPPTNDEYQQGLQPMAPTG